MKPEDFEELAVDPARRAMSALVLRVDVTLDFDDGTLRN